MPVRVHPWLNKILCAFASLRENYAMSAVAAENLPDARGHFGPYGGRYVPETLMHPLQELEEEYFRAQHDPEFQRELSYYLKEFCRPPHAALFCRTPHASELGGAKIYLKREDLNHTGAHKINNCHRPGPSRQAHGQDARHRRDRRGPARRRHRHRRRDVWHEMRHLHGRGGLPAAGAERLSHENARRGSCAGPRGTKDA